MAKVSIFGFRDRDLVRLRHEIEGSFGISFKEHESSEMGSYYMCAAGAQRLVLYPNWDGEQPLRDEFAAWPVFERRVSG